MNTQSNSYCRDNIAGSEQNRQVLVLVLLSKLALVLVIGLVYAGTRFLG
jgi:hypothetical protein